MLDGRDPQAASAIRAIVNEEQEHHDRSASHARASPVWLAVLGPLVTLATEIVIWMGMRL
jgi:ubiquinone biosynthesis monooxygenase Coq7